MMRPIDADALKEKVVDADYVPTGKWLRLSDLEDAPTVDAVPVVRCKDCKYWDKTWHDHTNGFHFCPMIENVSNGDFYCAYAERSEE